jgi:hypothetical protein
LAPPPPPLIAIAEYVVAHGERLDGREKRFAAEMVGRLRNGLILSVSQQDLLRTLFARVFEE